MAVDDIPKIVFGKEYFLVDPSDAALIVIDMQNSFIATDGLFNVPGGQEIIPAINRLVNGAREHGVPVIWTQSDHSPPAGGLILDRSPLVKYRQELWRGHPSFDLFPDVVQPVQGESSVTKHKYDAFHGTDLEMILRNLGKGTIVITGVTTECCCESTARAGFFRDLKVVVVSDAMASFTNEMHVQACDRIDLHFGRVMTSLAILDVFGSGHEAAMVAAPVGTATS